MKQNPSVLTVGVRQIHHLNGWSETILAHILVSVDSVPGTDLIRFTVADWGKGMDTDGVVNALQFGSKHTKEGYLCMYGVGLCNFLLVMTQNKYDWMVASKTPEENTYHVVKGPFALKMEMDDNDPGWQAIIQTIRNHHEMNPRNVRGNTLMDYCENLAARIRTDMPEHDVAVKYPVYANRGQVDVVDFAEDGTCELYNIENKNGSIKQLNRLLMGWNGMVAQGIQPTQATLVIPKCGPMLTHTVSEWNGCTQMMRPEQMQKIFEACGGDSMMLPT